MTGSKYWLIAAVAALLVPNIAMARTLKKDPREEAEQVCYDDAMKLCGDVVPDEAKITACMGQKHAQLSAPCAKVFDAGLKKK